MLLQKPTCPYAGKAAARAWGQGFELLPLTTSSADYAEDQRQAWAEGKACRAIAIAQAAQRYATAPTYEQACVIYQEAVALYQQGEVDKALAECPVGIPWEGTPSRPWAAEVLPKLTTTAPWGEVLDETALLNTARAAAQTSLDRHDYMPRSDREAAVFMPHAWVLAAMRTCWHAGRQSMKKADTSDSLPPAPAQTPFDGDVDDSEPAPVVTLKIGHVSAQAHKATTTLDRTIAAALREAKDADMPQGFIVALLQAHAQRETQTMLDS
jgi:hypothetical protein